MRCTPAGKRNRGRPKETWRQSVERDEGIVDGLGAGFRTWQQTDWDGDPQLRPYVLPSTKRIK